MTALGTGARRTAFRKLKEIPYRASYSHRGRYYTLDELIDGPEQQKSPPKSAFVLAPALRNFADGFLAVGLAKAWSVLSVPTQIGRRAFLLE